MAAKGTVDLRFDDSLETVLTADMSTPFGAQTAWRQLVDLIGRGRAPASEMAMARLRSIRPQVPSPIRAASARALAFARPPAPLVRLFAEEDLAIAAPVLRMADLRSDEWISMLQEMTPAARSVLRHRRDLPAEVGRALESYGPIDFILPAALPGVSPLNATQVPEFAPDAAAGAQPEPRFFATEADVGAETAVEPVDQAVIDTVEAQADPIISGEPITDSVDVDPVSDPAPLPMSPPLAEVATAVIAAPLMLAPTGTSGTPEPLAGPEEVASSAVEAVMQPEIEPAPERTPVSAIESAPMVLEGPLESAAAIADVPETLPEKQPDALSESLDVAEPLSIDWTSVIAARPAVAPTRPLALRLPNVQPAFTPPPAAPAPAAEAVPTPTPVERVADVPAETGSEWSFVSIATVAFGLPVVVEALRQQDDVAPQEIVPGNPEPVTADTITSLPDSELPPAALIESEPTSAPVPLALVEPAPIAAPVDDLSAAAVAAPLVGDGQDIAPRGPYQISDLVARIDAFNRQREETGRPDDETLAANDVAASIAPRSGFRFETDAAGTIRWVEGVARAAVIGISLDLASGTDAAKVDGVAAGAYRRRSAFADARLLIDGQSDAAGQWRISGVPVFDHATGRFTGYRGTARRPRADERAEPDHGDRSPAIDSLRQLVHELRTPTTAIAGFAEMIEGELLGPVPGPYRDYAETIRDQAMGLLGAIDDLDMAARIEAQALDLRPTEVPVGLLLQRIVHDLAPLATLRQASILLDIDAGDVAIKGDDRAVDRLFTRLFAALVSAGSAGETIAIRLGREGEDTVAVHIGRPRALAAYPGDALLAIDAESEAEIEGAPLLGTGFALRLARNLAVELGGSLTIGVDRLTLRLPAAFTQGVGQVSTI